MWRPVQLTGGSQQPLGHPGGPKIQRGQDSQGACAATGGVRAHDPCFQVVGHTYCKGEGGQRRLAQAPTRGFRLAVFFFRVTLLLVLSRIILHRDASSHGRLLTSTVLASGPTRVRSQVRGKKDIRRDNEELRTRVASLSRLTSANKSFAPRADKDRRLGALASAGDLLASHGVRAFRFKGQGRRHMSQTRPGAEIPRAFFDVFAFFFLLFCVGDTSHILRRTQSTRCCEVFVLRMFLFSVS